MTELKVPPPTLSTDVFITSRRNVLVWVCALIVLELTQTKDVMTIPSSFGFDKIRLSTKLLSTLILLTSVFHLTAMLAEAKRITRHHSKFIEGSGGKRLSERIEARLNDLISRAGELKTVNEDFRRYVSEIQNALPNARESIEESDALVERLWRLHEQAVYERGVSDRPSDTSPIMISAWPVDAVKPHPRSSDWRAMLENAQELVSSYNRSASVESDVSSSLRKNAKLLSELSDEIDVGERTFYNRFEVALPILLMVAAFSLWALSWFTKFVPNLFSVG